MNNIPPLGWVAIIVILLVAGAVNAWMIYLFRKSGRKGADSSPLRMRRAGGFDALKFIETARHPFKKENDQIAALSEQVKKLKEPDDR